MKKKVAPLRQKSLALPDISNPFIIEQKFTFLDKLQVAIMSLTIAPIRLLLIVILVYIAWAVATVGLACRSKADSTKPLSSCSLTIQRVFVALCRAMAFVAGFCRVKTKGKKVSAKEAPVLVCAPHSSMFDGIIFFLHYPLMSPVSRNENFNIPVIGRLLQFSQPILVQRDDPNSRVNTIKEIQRRCKSGGQWPQVVIFPEGTCANRTCLISFKLGAFYSGLPVQPVCLKFPNKLDTVTWTYIGPVFMTQMWLTLCQFFTRCEIEYLPVYKPNEKEINDARLFADNVRAQMAECLDVQVTDHTYDDCRLMVAAMKLNMPACVGLVEFEKLHSKLGIKYEEMHELLNKFNDMRGSKTGKEKAASMDFEQFSQYLMLPKSQALKQVFDLYDRDESGTIDFREYVIGLSLVSAPVNNDDTIELAFQLFDTDNNGYISKEELQALLGSAFCITEEDSLKIFQEVDSSKDGKITLDEFKSYAKKKPEYAKIFTTYRELKIKGQLLVENYTNLCDFNEDFDQWGPQVDTHLKKLQ